MAQRALVVGFEGWAINEDNTIFVSCKSLYTDDSSPETRAIMWAEVNLESSSPGSWMNQIKSAVTTVGNDNGFPALIAGQVNVPQFA